MEKYTKSSIFDSIEERYDNLEIEKSGWIIDLVSIFLVSVIVLCLMFLIAKQFNLF